MRTVLLRHDLRDGTSHYDWMIQRSSPPPGAAPGAEPPLITFRITYRIDRGDVGEFLAERIPDHRPDYLDWEGELSRGRGRVTRIAAGEVDLGPAGSDGLVIEGRLGAAVGVFRGHGTGGAEASDGGTAGAWRFTFEPRAPAADD